MKGRCREAIVFGVLVLAAGAVVARLCDLQIACADEYRVAAAKRHLTGAPLGAVRGRILGRDGAPLAVTYLAPTLYKDVGAHGHPGEAAAALHACDEAFASIQPDVLGGSASRPLVRGLSSRAYEAWLDLDARIRHGLFLRWKPVRRYPFGTIAGQVLGFVRTDQVAGGGIELTCDPWLSGLEGRDRTERDGRQRAFRGASTDPTPALRGCDVVLTLDVCLSTLAREALEEIAREHEPAGASIVAVDPRDGRILALESWPPFDPNAYSRSSLAQRLPRTHGAPLAPGSALKPIVVAAALEEGVITPGEVFDCEGGRWRYRGVRPIRDDHHAYGDLTITEILIHSSNIGVTKIADRLTAPRLYAWMRAFGFGDRTGTGLPGESRGLLRPLADWNPYYSLPAVAFGQEMACTPLQLVRAACALVNGGWLPSLRVIERIVDPSGHAVEPEVPPSRKLLSPSTVAFLRRALEAVVTEGNARWTVASPLLRIGGKSGTAENEHAGGCVSSFWGFAPVEDPRLLVLVQVDRPSGPTQYGSQVAGPSVRRMLEGGLSRMQTTQPRELSGLP